MISTAHCLSTLALLLLWTSHYCKAQHRYQDVQWANRVIGVSSEFPAGVPNGPFSAAQALGMPNKLPASGYGPCAWTPFVENGRFEEWIKVGFAKAMAIRQIAVAESFNPGSISEIFLYDQNQNEYSIYRNTDTKPIPESGRMFRVILPQVTPYQVYAVKVVLSTIDVPGWNQIDAIGISTSDIPVEALINLSDSTTMVEIENLGPNINSEYEEILPVISPDGRTLYFDRKNHPDNIKSEDRSMPHNDDIWYSELDNNGQWQPAIRMGEPLNNDSHNYVCTVTPDGNTLLLGNKYIKGGRSLGGVSISHRIAANEWSFPEELNINDYYNKSRYSEFYLANNQKTLLLAIQRDDSYGSRDLYVSFLQDDGKWSRPKNLGPQINTAAPEITPFLASDNRSLYFASSGLSGYGEMDMFVSRRLDDTWTNWSEPVNLGPQLNSKDWDASYTIDAAGEYAYFVSYNNSISKSADIFRAKLPQPLRPEAVVLMYGKVLNSKNNAPIEASILYEILPEGSEAGIASTNPVTGEYKITLPYKSRYGLLAKSKGFLSVNEMIDLEEEQNYQEIKRDLYLTPIEIGQSIRLNNVTFIQSKATLLQESFPELNRIFTLMSENPRMEIELEGHTDIEGSPMLNMKLSEERVKTIKKYLVEKGIAGNRIKTKAYGAQRPLTRKRDEASKQQNRRVEFRVLRL